MDRTVMSRFRSVLKLKFFDLEKDTRAPFRELIRPPRRRHVRRTIRYFRRTRAQATGYTVHCHAGVHRSTAFALLILYLETGDSQEAARALLRVHPIPLPNREITRIIDRMLGTTLTGEAQKLWTRAEDFLDDKIKIDPDDYLEELPSADE